MKVHRFAGRELTVLVRAFDDAKHDLFEHIGGCSMCTKRLEAKQEGLCIKGERLSEAAHSAERAVNTFHEE